LSLSTEDILIYRNRKSYKYKTSFISVNKE